MGKTARKSVRQFGWTAREDSDHWEMGAVLVGSYVHPIASGEILFPYLSVARLIRYVQRDQITESPLRRDSLQRS